MGSELILTSALLGAGLAMDAFSVSIANGLADRNMKTGRMLTIAGTFAAFQFAMPMAGWFLVKRMAEAFAWFGPLIPWIALVLLVFIGGGLLKDGISEMKEGRTDGSGADADDAGDGSGDTGVQAAATLSAAMLLGQGVATSIDALSVGFTTASYGSAEALVSSLIIGVVTLAICMAGLRIGRRLGELLAGRASILGGIILIGIGLEIWIRGVFF